MKRLNRILSLLVVVAIVGFLARKQLAVVGDVKARAQAGSLSPSVLQEER